MRSSITAFITPDHSSAKIKTYLLVSFMVVFISGMGGIKNACATPFPDLGKGHTNAFNTDNDGDGYISTGNRDGAIIAPLFTVNPNPEHMDPDANDNDPTINTPASVSARYGSFTNIQNFKNYVYDLNIGYTNQPGHQIGNVFFVSPNGNNATAQPNNINLPYLNSVPIPHYGPTVIHPGDIIVYLEGTYLISNSSKGLTLSHYGWAAGVGDYEIGYQGTSERRVTIMGEPGKRAIFRPANALTDNIFGIAQGTSYVTINGLEFDGQYAPHQFVYRVGLLNDNFSNVTIQNSEFRNGDRWIIFWAGGVNRHHITEDNITGHDSGYEHCQYHNGNMYPAFGHLLNATDTYITIQNSRFNYCGNGSGHGLHWRDGTHITIKNNMIHTTAWEGIEVKNGTQDMLIEGNLIFNVGRNALTIWNEDPSVNPMRRPISDIRIINNILVGMSGYNGLNDSGAYSAINIQHGETPPIPYSHENIEIKNNIIRSQSNYPIRFGYGPAFVNDLQNFHIENNLFWRDVHTAGHDQAGMLVCNDTGQGATSGPFSYSWCPNAYEYDLAAMQNQTYRPQFRNNVLGDPQFADFSLGYRLTPWLYNFDPTANSPSIDLGLSAVAPATDFRGHPRVGQPDAGVYEYGSVNPNTPIISSLTPNSIQNGITETPIHVTGANFNATAKVKLTLPGVGSVYIPANKVTMISSTELNFMFPAQFFAGTYKVTVENPGALLSNEINLVVSQNPAYLPSLTTITPTTWAAGTEAFITITGQNLGNLNEYNINFNSVVVTYGGREYNLNMAFIQSVSPSTIVLHAPANAPVGTYFIKVRTWAGLTPQTFNFVITASSGSGSGSGFAAPGPSSGSSSAGSSSAESSPQKSIEASSQVDISQGKGSQEKSSQRKSVRKVSSPKSIASVRIVKTQKPLIPKGNNRKQIRIIDSQIP